MITNDKELKETVTKELRDRGLEIDAEVDIEIREGEYSQSEDVFEILIGKMLIKTEECFAAIRKNGNKVTKIVLWVLLTGVPCFQFYFPNTYEAAKEVASIVASYTPEYKSDVIRNGQYVVTNLAWRTDESAYYMDQNKFFTHQITGSMNVAVTAYKISLNNQSFLLTGTNNLG